MGGPYIQPRSIRISPYQQQTNKKIEVHDIIDDSHVSGSLRHALKDLGTIYPQVAGTSPIPHFTPHVHPKKLGQQPAIDKELAQQLKRTTAGSLKFLQLSTNLHLKNKRKMYFPMDFGDLTIDGLINTGALPSAISEDDFKQIKQIAPKKS